MAMVLVPPTGSGLDFFSGICGSGSEQVGNSTLTLADTGASGTDNFHGMLPGLGISTCPSTLSGTYLPTDYFPGQDVFNSGGGGPSTYLSGGISASGTTTCMNVGPSVSRGSYNFTSAFGLPAAASSLQGT